MNFRDRSIFKSGTIVLSFLLVVLGIFLILRTPSAPALPSAKQKPNLVFITVDTLRADHTPFGSYSRSTMPNTAKFFKEGINFTQAATVRSRTVPAYASLLTGMYPYRTGVRDLFYQLHPSFETLPETLTHHGYVTAGFVSSFVMIGKLNHLNQGFHFYEDRIGEKRATVENYERRSDETVHEILKWLKQRPQEKPFFLFLHFIDPHGPYDAPPDYAKFQSNQKESLERQKIPNYQFRPGVLNKYEYVDQYDAEILFLDHNLSLLYAALSELEENTWFVFTADHGETLGERESHFSHGKYCYDSEIQIPMVWLPPVGMRSLYPAQEIRDPVSLVDIYPTSMQALGFSSPKNMDGESLLPRMRGEKLKNPYRFSEKVERKTTHKFTVRDERMKLIFNEGEAIETELYDLLNDPEERSNLANTIRIPTPLQEALLKYISDSKTYRLAFEVTAFPKELWKSGKDRTRFVEEHNADPEQIDEDREKLKALGYVD